MSGTFIPDRLKSQFDIETLIPEKEYIDQGHDYVSMELTQGKFTEESKTFFLE